MTRKRASEDILRTDSAREELVRGCSGLDLTAQDLSVRLVNVPLFRREEDGSLWQAIRVIVESEARVGDVSLSVSEGASVIYRTSANITEGRTVLHLLVPEVDRTKQVTFEMSCESGKPFWTNFEVHPQRKWSVSVIHQSHLDIGYTDTQASVLQHHMQYLDAVLDLTATTDDWPDESRFRWNVEATWPLQYWLRSRPKADREKLFERVRQGRVEICALPFTMHTEALSIDELARQLRFADELREEYQLPVRTAMQTDVPGATIGLLNCLVEADVRYLSVAHNYAGRSVPHLVGGQELTRPFYWQAPSGKRLLVWYTDTPHGSAYMEGNLVGLAEGYDAALDALPGYLKALAERPYPYEEAVSGWSGPPEEAVTKQPYPHDLLHLRVQGIVADNAAPSITPAEVVREWNENWAYPQLRLATNQDFFHSAEERLGNRLQTYSGDWTDWWVDGIGSAARPLGFNRHAQADIRTAQTLHVLADNLIGDDVNVSYDVEAAYENMALFDEHTWGAAYPWQDELDTRGSGALQWDTKRAFAQKAYEESDALLKTGAHRLSSIFPGSEPSLATVNVFNPCQWERTDLVQVFVPSSKAELRQSFSVVDAETQQRVPYVVEESQHAQFRPRGSYVSFIARTVPSYGYARYELVADGSARPEDQGDGDGHTIENEHYRLEFDLLEGSVAQLLDKDSGQELVNAEAPFGFNQYIYDYYGSAPHINHLSGQILVDDLSLLGKRSVARYGAVTERSSNAVWDRMTVRLNGEGSSFLETTLTLLRGVKRLDIKNRIGKLGTPLKESVYFAFPFNLKEPSLSYEITGGIDSPGAPHIPGSADHMRAIRHWTSLENLDSKVAWATMEAPLVQFGNIHLPYAPFPQTISSRATDSATIYSWALNNIWDTNFPPEQQGEMEFRYAIGTADPSGPGSSELGKRTAASLTAPLIGLLSTPRGTVHADSPERGSFCGVDRPDVEVVALIPSRRGHDLTVLLRSDATEPADVRLSFPSFSVEHAWSGSHLERNLGEVPVEESEVTVKVKPGELLTVSLDLAGT